MATEKQLIALEKWLTPVLKEGEDIGEMPFEMCSDALSRLSEASQAFKEGRAKRGSVKQAKEQIAEELRSHGWIGELTKTPEEEEQEQEQDCPKEQAEAEQDVYIDPEYEDLEGKFEPEPDGGKTKVEPGTIEKYVGILAQITQQVEAEERIPPTEKGYAINNVFQAVTRDMRSELIAALEERRGL